MQMYSSDRYYSHVEKDYVSRDEYSYTQGSNTHMMSPDHSQPKFTYGQNHGYGYGGYNNHEKKGHDGLLTRYSLAGYEEETRRHGWGGRDDHHAHGGYEAIQGHNGHYKEGMNHGAYGAPLGHNGPHKEGMNHGGYGAHQGYNGHYKEGTNHGGYGAYQGHNGHYNEGTNYGGHGAPQGHYGPKVYPEMKKVSIWASKGIVD